MSLRSMAGDDPRALWDRCPQRRPRVLEACPPTLWPSCFRTLRANGRKVGQTKFAVRVEHWTIGIAYQALSK